MRAFLPFFSCVLVVAQAGCFGSDDGGDDCDEGPSACPSLLMLDFCSSGACTFNGTAPSCTTSRCEIPSAGTFVIPVDGRIDATMPDLGIHVVGNDPASLRAVRFDGTDVPFEFDSVDFIVRWVPGTGNPKTIELDLAPSAPSGIGFRFYDEQCETDERLACNGGGA
jgi:hypothetical protein